MSPASRAGRDFSFSASHPQAGVIVGRPKVVVRGSEWFEAMRVGKRGADASIAETDGMIDSLKFTE